MKRVLKMLEKRKDLEAILNYIEEGSRVLDIGCGDGSLLYTLKKIKKIQAFGLEIDEEKIAECVSKGLSVIQYDLNKGLPDYQDKAFDFVILSQTLQQVARPDQAIKEVVRVGKKAIVSVPNFGFWKCRFDLFFKGKTPVTKALPHMWYNTPNLRVLTIKDFNDFCQEIGVRIIKTIPLLSSEGDSEKIISLFSNLRADYCVFMLETK
ncbi:MAG: methionine biosynthesis protein MetW [Candidatus Margulisbacteria bacterium]|nr:methionine biosynthesis protein MetW [Candidatus Margulisiibacteriota bacterium]